MTVTKTISRDPNTRDDVRASILQASLSLMNEGGLGALSMREVARRATSLEVDMPIVQAVCAVIDGHLSAAAAVEQLMSRDPKHE